MLMRKKLVLSYLFVETLKKDHQQIFLWFAKTGINIWDERKWQKDQTKVENSLLWELNVHIWKALEFHPSQIDGRC